MKRVVLFGIVSFLLFNIGYRVANYSQVDGVADIAEEETMDIKVEEVKNIEDSKLWDREKSEKLNQFIAKWTPSIKQEYIEYTPEDNVNFYGVELPSQVLTTNKDDYQVIVGQTPITLKWSENGLVDYGYALVAVYSDAQTQEDLQKHVYFFTISAEGTPVVLMTMQDTVNKDQYMYFYETKSEELKNEFTNIVFGRKKVET